MAFGEATVVTKGGYGVIAKRIQGTPSVASPRFIAMGVGATGADRTAVNTDTGLSDEVETRTNGTESNQTTTEAGDTYQVVGAITTTAARAVDEMGLFTAAASGTMAYSATHNVVNLDISDSIQYTAKIQIVAP